MATYAGFQRYEVPDIGGNVAKIMLAQKDAAAKRATAQQTADYRQAKLDAANKKEADKEGKDRELLIDKDATELRKTNLEVPSVGYNSFDAMILGSTEQIKTELNNNAKILREKGNDYLSEYNQKKQGLNGVSGRLKNTVSAMGESLKKINTEENPNVFTKYIINETMKNVTPSDDNKMSLQIKPNNNGGLTISFVNYAQDGTPIEKPLESLNSVAALSEFKAPDYNAEMTKLVSSVGVETIEQKYQGGSRTILNPKTQDNFKRTAQTYVNSILARPIVAADAYMKFVSTPADPALFISADASPEQRELIAKQNGYESAEKADFVEYATNPKTGLPEIKLTDKQDVALRNKLTESFIDKAPYKESFSSPSTTNFTANVINHDGRTDETLTETSFNLDSKEGIEAANIIFKNAMRRGDIGEYEIEKVYPGVPKDIIDGIKAKDLDVDKTLRAMKAKGLVENIEGHLSGNIIVYPKTGSGKKDYDLNKPLIINATTNQKLYRQYAGYIGDASGFRNQTKNTYPEEKPKK